MPIDMDNFAADGLFPGVGPSLHQLPLGSVICIQCRCCGFEVEDVEHMPKYICPKCNGSAWERFARPGSSLRAAGGELAAVPDSRRFLNNAKSSASG